MGIGSQIKRLRENAQIAQKELAKVLNVANSTLCQYENGERVPSDEVKIKIADYFGVSIDYLLEHQPKTGTLKKQDITREALNIAEAFDKASEKDKNTVRQVLGEYMLSKSDITGEKLA